jgi:hypothetical protein
VDSMRTISRRVAFVALVLAAIASVITGASLAQASRQPGPSQWLKAPGLRWQAIARASQRRADEAGFPTAQGLRADGLRWQGIARVYQLREPATPQYYGSRAPYAPTVRHEQPLPPYYGSTAPYTTQCLKADGLRWQAIARVYEQKQQATQAASLATGNGFDCRDAGIGLAAGI